MSYSSYDKAIKQLVGKPAKHKKFIKHNAPKTRKYGKAVRKCKRCGRIGAHNKKYGLDFCRQCFREVASSIGFKKYS